MTDNNLMFSFREGNTDQIGILFKRYHKKLYGFFLGLTGNHQDSDDLVQEVFLKIIKYKHSFRGKGAFTTWMFRIGYNCYYDCCKSNEKQENSEYDISDLSVPANQLNTIYEEDKTRMVHSALQILNEKDKAIILMSFYLRLKYIEIAKILGFAEGTIKARAFYAFRKLKKSFKRISFELY